MPETYIHSRQNEQVKNLVKLRERKHRIRQQCFFVEGLRELGHALKAGVELDMVYYCPEHFPTAAHSDFINELRESGRIELTCMSDDAFSKAAFREGPDGLIALARQKTTSLDQLKLSKQPLLLILEGIEKPGNLGAILRSADGAGADAIILVDCILDLYNPNAIRSSQGLIFALPIVSTQRDALQQWLKEQSIQTVATTPDTLCSHWDADYQLPSALLFGSESHGLTPFWLEQSQQLIRIPMAGQADSLNVAAAAAVCLYEAQRQRKAK
jgi:RNA methyltransferase, TrmH family